MKTRRWRSDRISEIEVPIEELTEYLSIIQDRKENLNKLYLRYELPKDEKDGHGKFFLRNRTISTDLRIKAKDQFSEKLYSQFNSRTERIVTRILNRIKNIEVNI